MPIADFARITRPLNCIMAAIAAFIGYSIAFNQLVFSQEIFLGMLAVFLICGAGQAINDYFDRKIDKKLHPEKPIPSGKIKPFHALFFSIVLFIVGIVFSLFLPLQATLIAIVFSLLLILYSAFLQKLKFVGNYVVALGTAFTIIFGASIQGNLFVPGILAVSAFFSNSAREIIKDFDDMNADKGYKKSLPMILPQEIVFAIIFVFYLIAIVFSYVPFFLGLFGNNYYLYLVFIANIAFVDSFLLTINKKFAKAHLWSKIGMVIALLGFLVGVG